MFGLDAARVADPIVTTKPGEGLVSARKKTGSHKTTPPVFSSEEKEFKIQIPDGWSVR